MEFQLGPGVHAMGKEGCKGYPCKKVNNNITIMNHWPLLKYSSTFTKILGLSLIWTTE